jgi:hypothetical protein
MMSETTVQTNSTGFKIGFAILLFIAVSSVLGHIGLMLFDPGGDVVFVAWAAFNFMAAAILIFAYRQAERWAWYVTWGMVVPYALVILFNSEVGPIYLAEAILLAVGQMLAYGSFFGERNMA